MAARRSNYNSNWKKPAPPAKTGRVERVWSVFQQKIFDWIEVNAKKTNTHLVVIARAGSGKTTTIVESLYHVPKGLNVVFCAFNKKIAEELSTRSPEGVDVMTLHSMGFRALRKVFPQAKPDTNKSMDIAKNLLGDEPEKRDDLFALVKTVAFAKGCLASTKEEIDAILDGQGIEFTYDRSAFIDYVLRALKLHREQTNIIDFDDMIWFPIIYNMRLSFYDWVFLDECQDLNKAQIELAKRAVKSNGHIVSVGDNRQAIYQFRGADERAVQNIIDSLNADTLPLSVTYRCGKRIVELAQSIVPDFEAGDNNIDGNIMEASEKALISMARPGDFVLSRSNAPLIGHCLSFIKAGIPANIQGRDMGSNLIYFIKKSGTKTVMDLMEYVVDWRSKEMERLSKINRPTEAIDDKAECVLTLCDGAKEIKDVIKNIENLFADDDDSKKVIFSTTHKAKGLERDRVFVISRTYKPGKNEAESNLYYVAITRAKSELFLLK